MDDLVGLRPENINVRYLVWRVDKNPANWPIILTRQASIPETRGRSILNGAPLTDEERCAIVEGFSVVMDDLGSHGLFGLSGPALRRKNIKYLIDRLPHGESKKMARALNVANETVSRWKKTGVTDSFKPSKILRYLGIDSDIDLNNIPLFLSINPVGRFAIKKWLMDRIDTISPDELTKLFPALKKIFSKHAGN